MILVTGGTGLLGKAISKYYNLNESFLCLSSREGDLRDKDAVRRIFELYEPRMVLHLAAKVGGIISNSSLQYDFFTDNLAINTNVVDECVRRNCKLFAVSSTCVYPKHGMTYPLRESCLHDGVAEPSNFGYAYAKRMMDVQLDAAKDQHGYESCIMYLGNLYGVDDHFNDPFNSHLVPALISKFHNAKINNLKSVELYGDGTPLRQFTLADDVAKIILWMLKNEVVGKYNIANPENITIRNIANIVKDAVGYEGEITYNGKLNGMHRKDVDCSNLLSLMDFKFTTLHDGVQKVYNKVKDNLCGN